MKNSEIKNLSTEQSALINLLKKAKEEQRRDCALAFSVRIDNLCSHIIKEELNLIEALELLRFEARRFDMQSWRLH